MASPFSLVRGLHDNQNRPAPRVAQEHKSTWLGEKVSDFLDFITEDGLVSEAFKAGKEKIKALLERRRAAAGSVGAAAMQGAAPSEAQTAVQQRLNAVEAAAVRVVGAGQQQGEVYTPPATQYEPARIA